MSQIMNLVMILFLFITDDAKGDDISILGKKYWRRTIFHERHLAIPDGIDYEPPLTKVYIGNETLHFTKSDFTKYKIVPGGKIKNESKKMIDDSGNAILNIGGLLIFTDKMVESGKMIKSKEDNKFHEIIMDTKRSRAFMIGTDDSYATTGRLYVLNTKQPNTTTDTIIVTEIEKIGSYIRTLSVDNISGDVMLIEKDEHEGWRLVLLEVNDFKLLANLPVNFEQFNQTRNFLTKKIYNDKIRSKLHRKIIFSVNKMTDKIIKSCIDNCDQRMKSLIMENLRLRHQLSEINRAKRHILKSAGIYFRFPEKPIEATQGSDDEMKASFAVMVKNTGINITKMLNDKTVKWLDEGECPATGNNKTARHCGVMTYYPIESLFPWTVALLGSKCPYIFMCYGTLIHPKLVVLSENCAKMNDTMQFSIVRHGKVDPSLLYHDIHYLDRYIVHSDKLNFGIRNITGGMWLVLHREYEESSTMSPVCLPQFTINPTEIKTCYSLLSNLSSTLKPDVVPFYEPEVCNVLGGTFYCKRKVKGFDDFVAPKREADHDILYCPYPKTHAKYMIYGISIGYVIPLQRMDIFIKNLPDLNKYNINIMAYLLDQKSV